MNACLSILIRFVWVGMFSLALGACAQPAVKTTPQETPATSVDALEQLRKEAKLLTPMMQSDLGREFLAATGVLTAPTPRILFRSPDSRDLFGEEAAARLGEEERKALVAITEPELLELFYNTYHGTPLAYSRAIDLLGAAGLTADAGRRLVDFGFGNVGQLRLLASLGFAATGIEVAPYLAELYSHPSDQGPYASGQVKVIFGRYPTEEATVEAVGSGLDVFLSKNTLKRGYIHPYRTPAKPEWVIKLGVTDEEFLQKIHDALKPGGKFLIYNICPALSPEDQPFIPWSDGRSPFSQEQFAAAGFRVLAFDVDDTAFVRKMGRLLGWDQGPQPLDLEHNLSVLYTLVERT